MSYDTGGDTSHRTINGIVTDFTFNNENQFSAATVHASGGDQQTTSIYDTAGALLVRKDPTGTTLYAAGQEYKLAAGTVTVTRYYRHGDLIVAVRTNGGKQWLAADHQGSADLTVNATTAAVQRRWYAPYGDNRATQGTWPTDRGFLDKETNTSTGLIDDGAREYDPNLGLFISPDPLTNPNDPATYNAYAYAGHNPITASDPTGLCERLEDYDGPCVSQLNTPSGQARLARVEKHRLAIDLSWRRYHARQAADRANNAKAKFLADIFIASIGGSRDKQNALNDMKLQQANYLNAANEERDNFIGYLQDLRDTGQISNRQLQSVQVVTAAWDPKTGKIYLGWKISGYGPSGWCAEDDCAAQAGKDGVDPKTLQFTMALRPRDGGQMRICPNCQADYDEAQFADSGAEGAPGGRWDQIRAQAAALANSSDDVLDEAFGTALSESEELEDEGE